MHLFSRPGRITFGTALGGLAACAALFATQPTAAAASAADNPLVAERWKTRPLVLVVPAADHPMLKDVQSARDTPAGRQAFAERDMVLYVVAAGQGSREGRALTPVQTQALLAALELDARSPASLVLVGKDGGAKLGQRDRADLPAVYLEIDGMPMRRAGR